MDHYTGHDLAFFSFLVFSAWRFHLLCNVHGNTLLFICKNPRANRWNKGGVQRGFIPLIALILQIYVIQYFEERK